MLDSSTPLPGDPAVLDPTPRAQRTAKGAGARLASKVVIVDSAVEVLAEADVDELQPVLADART